MQPTGSTNNESAKLLTQDPTGTMQPPESFARRFPSGTQNLSKDVKNNYNCDTRDRDGNNCGHPCLVTSMGEVWENERDACMEGRVVSCLGWGLLSRVTHLLSCSFDTVTTVAAAPIVCVGGTAVGVGARCLSSLVCCTVPCYSACSNKDATATVSQEADKIGAFSNKIIRQTWGCSAVLVGTCLIDNVMLPVNLIAPEAANLLCFQQERNRCLNHHMASNQDKCCGSDVWCFEYYL